MAIKKKPALNKAKVLDALVWGAIDPCGKQVTFKMPVITIKASRSRCSKALTETEVKFKLDDGMTPVVIGSTKDSGVRWVPVKKATAYYLEEHPVGKPDEWIKELFENE